MSYHNSFMNWQDNIGLLLCFSVYLGTLSQVWVIRIVGDIICGLFNDAVSNKDDMTSVNCELRKVCKKMLISYHRFCLEKLTKSRNAWVRAEIIRNTKQQTVKFGKIVFGNIKSTIMYSFLLYPLKYLPGFQRFTNSILLITARKELFWTRERVGTRIPLPAIWDPSPTYKKSLCWYNPPVRN
jgi:hypothetical protein